jgi:hypothetical protein
MTNQSLQVLVATGQLSTKGGRFIKKKDTGYQFAPI